MSAHSQSTETPRQAVRTPAGPQVAHVRADLLPVPVVLEGVVEEAVGRGTQAWEAGQGRRRWPWATGAALAGAALGVAGALLVRRLRGGDAPGAQEPEELEAVVDTVPAVPVVPPGAVVDEDGEVVLPRDEAER